MHERTDTPADPRLLLRIPDACERLGIGRTTFYALIAAGEIETVVLGRRRLVPVAAIDAFVERLRSLATAAAASPPG